MCGGVDASFAASWAHCTSFLAPFRFDLAHGEGHMLLQPGPRVNTMLYQLVFALSLEAIGVHGVL